MISIFYDVQAYSFNLGLLFRLGGVQRASVVGCMGGCQNDGPFLDP